MKNKTIKALAKINILLDEDHKKLYDKYKNIELSHNRKYKLLKYIENNLKILNSEKLTPFNMALIENLLFKINSELTYCGRVKGIF